MCGNEKNLFLSSTNSVCIFPSVDDKWTCENDKDLILTNQLISFNVFPKTEADLLGNEFIWKAAQDTNFRNSLFIEFSESSTDDTYNQVKLHTIFIPRQLYLLLNCVSLTEMHHMVHCLIADSVQADDETDYISQLPAKVWKEVQKLLSQPLASDIFDGDKHGSPVRYVSKQSLLLDDILVDHADSNDPWKIAIYTGVSIPRIPSEVRSHPLIEKCYFNQHFHHSSSETLESLFQDWRAFQEYSYLWKSIVNCNHSKYDFGNLSFAFFSPEIIFTELIVQRKLGKFYGTIHTILKCTQIDRSWLSLIPQHLLEENILPFVMLSYVVSWILEYASECL